MRKIVLALGALWMSLGLAHAGVATDSSPTS